jgi:GlpG protein
MRLIASCEKEEQASLLYSALKNEKIESVFEAVKNSAGMVVSWDVWIIEEDDFDKACDVLESFYKKIAGMKEEVDLTSKGSVLEKPMAVKEAFSNIKIKPLSHSFVRIRMNAPLTRLMILCCVFVFFWTNVERVQLLKKYPSLGEYALFTPTTQNLLYDFPASYEKFIDFFKKRPQLDVKNKNTWSIKDRSIYLEIEKMPVWKGFYEVLIEWKKKSFLMQAPKFVKIFQGEAWRVVTPIFLHGNFLHILFNMLWLFLLGKELEIKIGKIRLIVMFLVAAIITNTCQYLMSGPLFLGFSGVICALGGFIWTRERIAPWEGYAVPKGTLSFLFVFVLGMMVLQLIAFSMTFFHLGTFSVSGLGNTGHVVGLAVGCMLARIPMFYRLRG